MMASDDTLPSDITPTTLLEFWKADADVRNIGNITKKGKPPRPRNSFIIFRCLVARYRKAAAGRATKGTKKGTNELEDTAIDFAKWWHIMKSQFGDEAERVFKHMADEEFRTHRNKYPGYKFQPGSSSKARKTKASRNPFLNGQKPTFVIPEYAQQGDALQDISSPVADTSSTLLTPPEPSAAPLAGLSTLASPHAATPPIPSPKSMETPPLTWISESDSASSGSTPCTPPIFRDMYATHLSASTPPLGAHSFEECSSSPSPSFDPTTGAAAQPPLPDVPRLLEIDVSGEGDVAAAWTAWKSSLAPSSWQAAYIPWSETTVHYAAGYPSASMPPLPRQHDEQTGADRNYPESSSLPPPDWLPPLPASSSGEASRSVGSSPRFGMQEWTHGVFPAAFPDPSWDTQSTPTDCPQNVTFAPLNQDFKGDEYLGEGSLPAGPSAPLGYGSEPRQITSGSIETAWDALFAKGPSRENMFSFPSEDPLAAFNPY